MKPPTNTLRNLSGTPTNKSDVLLDEVNHKFIVDYEFYLKHCKHIFDKYDISDIFIDSESEGELKKELYDFIYTQAIKSK